MFTPNIACSLRVKNLCPKEWGFATATASVTDSGGPHLFETIPHGGTTVSEMQLCLKGGLLTSTATLRVSVRFDLGVFNQPITLETLETEVICVLHMPRPCYHNSARLPGIAY
jgi:hypothetical protein